MSQAESTASNLQKVDKAGQSVEKDESPKREPVKSKEAARKNILAYVGKMKAKEEKEEKEVEKMKAKEEKEEREAGKMKAKEEKGEREVEKNGNGFNLAPMQDEPEEEKGGSSAENEELLPNGEEMIEKINGS